MTLFNKVWPWIVLFEVPALCFAQTTVANPVVLSNSGVFTNAQMNEYVQSLINGCSPLTEFSYIFTPPSKATEALTGCIITPNGATNFQSNTIGAYANNQNGAATATVALFGLARNTVQSNGRIWGANFLATDTAGFPSNSIYAAENDCNIVNAASVCHGLLITGFWNAQPAVTVAVEIGPVQQGAGCTTCVWPYGLRFDQGATAAPTSQNAAIIFFPVASGLSQPSQGLSFLSNNASGSQDGATLNEAPSGDLLITNSTAGRGLVINGNNATQTIGTGNATSAGTSIATLTCQAQTIITVTGALTSDSVVPNIGATLPATWQTGIQVSAHVTGSNMVTVYLCNPTAGAITPAATRVNVRVMR